MNPKQIQKIHKFLTPPFTTEVAVTPDMLKDRKEITIFSFSPFFWLNFVAMWHCGCLSTKEGHGEARRMFQTQVCGDLICHLWAGWAQVLPITPDSSLLSTGSGHRTLYRG